MFTSGIYERLFQNWQGFGTARENMKNDVSGGAHCRARIWKTLGAQESIPSAYNV
jgi:hypothetical protein